METDATMHFWRWLWQAPLGLTLIGFGLSLFGQAVIYKAREGAPVKKWFWWGTLSLVVINVGVCVFADAVMHRASYETLQPRAARKVAE